MAYIDIHEFRCPQKKSFVGNPPNFKPTKKDDFPVKL